MNYNTLIHKVLSVSKLDCLNSSVGSRRFMGTVLSHCSSSDSLRHWYSTRATERTTRCGGLRCWYHMPKACAHSPHVPWQFTRLACAIKHAWETHRQITSSFNYLQVKNANRRLLFLYNQHGNVSIVWCIQALTYFWGNKIHIRAQSRWGGGEQTKTAHVIKKTYEPIFILLDAYLDLILLNKQEFPH